MEGLETLTLLAEHCQAALGAHPSVRFDDRVFYATIKLALRKCLQPALEALSKASEHVYKYSEEGILKVLDKYHYPEFRKELIEALRKARNTSDQEAHDFLEKLMEVLENCINILDAGFIAELEKKKKLPCPELENKTPEEREKLERYHLLRLMIEVYFEHSKVYTVNFLTLSIQKHFVKASAAHFSKNLNELVFRAGRADQVKVLFAQDP